MPGPVFGPTWRESGSCVFAVGQAWQFLAPSTSLLPVVAHVSQAGQGSFPHPSHAPFSFIPLPLTQSPHANANLPFIVPPQPVDADMEM